CAERTITINNLAVLYLQSYPTIPIDKINKYKELNSLYNLVKSHGINIGSAKHIISATNISTTIAKLLGVKANSAGLTMERITFNQHQTPIIYETGVFRTDLYEFTFIMDSK